MRIERYFDRDAVRAPRRCAPTATDLKAIVRRRHPPGDLHAVTDEKMASRFIARVWCRERLGGSSTERGYICRLEGKTNIIGNTGTR